MATAKSGPNDARWPATTKTGLNDASRIVWAIGTSIFILFLFFRYSLMFCYIYMMFSLKYMMERPATTKTGPNDVSHIIWAIGEGGYCKIGSKRR